MMKIMKKRRRRVHSGPAVTFRRLFLSLVAFVAIALGRQSTANAFDPIKLFKSGVQWIGELSVLISAADQLGALYACGGLCSVESDRTNSEVISQIGHRLDVLTQRIELLEFGQSVRSCHSLARARNQALSGPLSELDSETLASDIASFDGSGGRGCLTVIHDAIMGNGLSNDEPALNLYLAYAREQVASRGSALADRSALTESLDIVAIFWAELVALQNTLFAQTWWGVMRFHENEQANATASLTSLSNQFTSAMKEQFAYAGSYFGCRAVDVGWLRFACAARRKNLTEVRAVDEALRLPELFENQTDRVHEPKLMRIAAFESSTDVPLRWLRSWKSAPTFTAELKAAAVVGFLDGAQQPPEQWTELDPLFCLRNKADGSFLHIGNGGFGDEDCGPRGTFSLHLHTITRNRTAGGHGCEYGLQKGAACCPWACDSCEGSTTNTSATCWISGTNTTAPSECCSAGLLNPIVTPEIDYCSPPNIANATMDDDNTEPCIMDVPIWPGLPRDDAYELVCLKHNATNNFISIGGPTEDATIVWAGGEECSVEAGTVWMLFPSTVAEAAFERELGVQQDGEVLNSGQKVAAPIAASIVSACVAVVLAVAAYI